MIIDDNKKDTLNWGTFSIWLTYENLRRSLVPSNTCLVNKAVTSRGGGVYLPHWLTKKSIKSSLVGIFVEKLVAPIL